MNKHKVSLAVILAAFIGGFSPCLSARGQVLVNSSIAADTYGLPSDPTNDHGSQGSIPVGGGSGAIDAVKVEMAPYLGTLLNFSVTYTVSTPAEDLNPGLFNLVGTRVSVGFSHVPGGFFENATYTGLVTGRVYDGEMWATLGLDRLGNYQITFGDTDKFTEAANNWKVFNTGFEFNADDLSIFGGPDGISLSSNNGPYAPYATGITTVPEPSSIYVALLTAVLQALPFTNGGACAGPNVQH